MKLNREKTHKLIAPAFMLSVFVVTPVDALIISKIPGTIASSEIPTSTLHILLTILAILILVSGAIINLSLKLKKANRNLREKNSTIEEINAELKLKNGELEEQKKHIVEQHSESDKFFSMLNDAAEDGISFFDTNWNLKFANRTFYTLIGHTKETYDSLKPSDFLHSEDKNYHETKIKELGKKGYYETEIRLLHKSGNYITLLSKSVQVRNDIGDLIGTLTISRDITKLKAVHEELIKANLEAETSNRLKTSFLANISHEIRTPLNSVVGFSNLLLANDLTIEAKAEYVEHINHNSEKLLQIIGDIIDLSRLESSQIEITYEEASLGSIINEVVAEAREVIKRNEKSIILNVSNLSEDSSDLIFTDRIWLKRVLNHLMDNAIKFTLDGFIEFAYIREDDNIRFKIKDTGIGISKENLKNIFEQFRQEIDGHHRPFEGLGIGLTLAKEVVERMGGKIYVESEKGMGSVFSFSIPYRPAGSTRARMKEIINESNPDVLDWTGRKCLIVDDNKDVLLYLNRILLDTGIGIVTARSGYEAIEVIKTDNKIDLVILDMQMPEMNGIEATKHIRTIRSEIPIIAQTAFIFEDDKDIIIEAGCDACLIKPIRRDHLITVMSSFIKPLR